MIHGSLQKRLSRESLRFASGAFVAIGVVLLTVSFATAVNRWTVFGTPLGPDFTAMYVAGTVLNEHGADELYNFRLQDELRHELVPRLAPTDRLPYLYAPWFAPLWRPLALLPYETAYAVWLVLGLALYAGGFRLLAGACSNLDRRDAFTALLVGLSFEPFLFECWINGQVSTIPFFAVCLSLWLQKNGREFAGGAALAVCLYKPTQGVLIFLLLAIGGRRRALAGAVCGGLVLAGLSAALFGPRILVDYPSALLAYREAVASGELSLRLWKYVDLRSFAELAGPAWQVPLLCALSLAATVIFVRLIALWRRTTPVWDLHREQAWAATLVAVPVLHAYFGICDAILAVPGVVLAFDLWRGRTMSNSGIRMTKSETAEGAVRHSSFRQFPLPLLLLVLYFTAMIAPLYATLAVNFFTMALLATAWRLSGEGVRG